MVLAGLVFDLKLRLWEHEKRVIEYDVHGYYGFLPALFILDDIRLEKSDYKMGDDYYWFWVNTTPDGRHFIKYPVGMAFLYAPFFFAGHAIALLTDAPATGFSPPYKVMLQLAGLVYLVLGLLLTRATLRRLGFTEHVVALALLALGLGTNVFAYATQSGTMPHVHGFFLVAAFMLMCLRWWEHGTWRNTLLLGAILGMLVLVRPTNAVVLLFLPLVGIARPADVPTRIDSIIQRLPQLLAMALAALLVWLPQSLYWWTVLGTPIFYSYQDEGFFFGHPHLLDGLFGFRKGWLLYTPMMAFAVAGLFAMRGRERPLLLGIAAVLVIHTYITLSWWCWWYGGSFGQRAMIEIYALLAIPLAAAIRWLLARPFAVRATGLTVGACLVLLNLFQTYQVELGVLHYDAMTGPAYVKQFGRLTPAPGWEELLDYPDYEKARATGKE
ncbi:MAG: hypothetical protein KF797_05440 [Flavobacteriales bacterium]|nr:hypothetical protein [Flavobacteriales bacterium]